MKCLPRQITAISAFDYDAAGRRVSRIDTFDGAMTTNVFGYNVRTEVTSAAMGTNTYGYAYDPVGNRITSSHNGETTTYTANNLNQYSAITYPLSSPPSHLSYDSDGNMTADGSGWHYTWNGENRMVCASNDEVIVTYAYDHRGRMVRKNISYGDAKTQSIAYLWDDWNLIRETIVSPASTLVTHNVWGLDLDGTLQGAGGVGGLLAVARDQETFLTTYDANGNVGEYVMATNGVIASHYEYSPFGGQLVSPISFPYSFTHQYSTKPYCRATGLSEYQLREYRSRSGRWICRDFISEVSFYTDASLHSIWPTWDFSGNSTSERRDIPTKYIGSDYLHSPDYAYCKNALYATEFLGLFSCTHNQEFECKMACSGKPKLTRASCSWNLIVCFRCICYCRWDLLTTVSSGTGYYRSFTCVYASPLGSKVHEAVFYDEIPGVFSCLPFMEGSCEK